MPSSRMVDFFMPSKFEDNCDKAYNLSQGYIDDNSTPLPSGKLSTKRGYRIILNRVFSLNGNKKNIILGIGWQRYILKYSAVYSKLHMNIGSNSMSIIGEESETIVQTPIVRAGFEWKPQSRVGFSVFGICNPLNKPVKMKAILESYSPVGIEEIVVRKIIFPRYYIGTSIALYF